MSLLRHDSSFCKTSSWNKYDYPCSDGSYFLSYGHRISQWNFDILSPPILQEYADVIYAKGAPLNNCFGFIDGTVRPISRPGQHQRIVHNGHKQLHSLKFQSIALPSGLIRLFGDIINNFKLLNFKKNLKIGMSSVGKMYLVCALLNNAITCLYGNKTSVFFGVGPPSLQYYFRWTLSSKQSRSGGHFELNTNLWSVWILGGVRSMQESKL